MQLWSDMPPGQMCTFHKHASEVGAPTPAVHRIELAAYTSALSGDLFLCAVCKEFLSEDLKKNANRFDFEVADAEQIE